MKESTQFHCYRISLYNDSYTDERHHLLSFREYFLVNTQVEKTLKIEKKNAHGPTVLNLEIIKT